MQSNQKEIWNREYSERNFMSGTRPQKSFLRFIKEYKKKLKEKGSYTSTEPFDGITVLDLGSGEGKNAIYLAERGACVQAIEISSVAIQQATKHKNITYLNRSFAEVLPFKDASFDIILDITSSNALTEIEREHFLKEVARVLKGNGVVFVRALCKDGDKNAKYLLKEHPITNEKDMYTMPETGLKERVFSKQDLRSTYEKYVRITYLEKETHYTTIAGKKFKRNFWVLNAIHKQSK